MQPRHKTLLVYGFVALWILLLPIMCKAGILSLSSTGEIHLAATNQLSTLPLRELWCVDSDTTISRPMYMNGLVYILEGDDPIAIKAYQARTGQFAWSGEAHNDSAAGTLGYWSIENGSLVIGTGASIVVFEALTGDLVWQTDAWSNGFSIGDGKVFAGGPENVRAYDLNTGDLIWDIPGQGRGWSVAPLYDLLNDVVVLNEATYRLVSPDTGELLFEMSRLSKSDLSYGPNGGQVHNGLLLYVDEAFEISSGELVHPRAVPGSQSVPPFIAENDYLLLTDFTDIVAVDLADFKQVWRYQSPSVSGPQLQVLGDPVALNGIVYTILSDATLRALDLLTGNVLGLWQGKSVVDRRFGNTPFVPGLAVGDGLLFATFGTNRLCAFGK